MPNTYQLISSNVLSTSAASVTFSAIPSTYTDLVLRISARGLDAALNTETMQFFVNNSTSAQYSYRSMRNFNSTATSDKSSGNSSGTFSRVLNGNSSTSNSFMSYEIYIPSYTASQAKPISGFGGAEESATANYYNNATAALWNNTAAITSFKLQPNNSSAFAIDSSFYLYGIKNS
jgi:hypothetical protein